MHEHAILGLVKTAACALTTQRNSENFEKKQYGNEGRGQIRNDPEERNAWNRSIYIWLKI